MCERKSIYKLHTTIMLVCDDIGAAGVPPARLSSPLRDCEHRAASVRVIEQQDSLDGSRLSANMKKGVMILHHKTRDSGIYTLSIINK